jgi:hypothetical protein
MRAKNITFSRTEPFPGRGLRLAPRAPSGFNSRDASMSDTDSTPSCLSISLIIDRVINYAFQQNAIPVVKQLLICNNATPRKDLTIRITTEPAFATPMELRLQAQP